MSGGAVEDEQEVPPEAGEARPEGPQEITGSGRITLPPLGRPRPEAGHGQ